MYGKRRADLVLLSLFVLFTAAIVLKYYYPGSFWAGLVHFSLEAALIGGVADWFAVTALFSRPLGFSWHTALIPNNREAISNSVAAMVKDELLSAELLGEKIDEIDSVGMITAWVKEDRLDETTGEYVAGFIHDRISCMDGKRIAEDLEIFLKNSIRNASLSEQLKKALSVSIEKDRSREWTVRLAGLGAEYIKTDAAREKIIKILRDWEHKKVESSGGFGGLFVKTFLSVSKGSEHTNTFALAAMLQDELSAMLAEMKDPSHAMHDKIRERLLELADSMDKNKNLVKSVETWKEGLIEKLQLQGPLGKLICAGLESEGFKKLTLEWGSKQLDGYWEKLKTDPGIKNWLDEIIKSALIRIINMEHYLIGEIVRETLGAFTDKRLIAFIEEKVGEDLQWIRINGSVVGSAAGLLLYLFLKLLYDPYIAPAILSWFAA